MPARKVSDKKSKTAPSEGAVTSTSINKPSEVFFPFARYTSVAGVYTSLLAFSALILPRTSISSLMYVSPSASSDGEATTDRTMPRDGIQLLTESPVRTVAWICIGSLVLQAWWSSWLRSWSLESRPFAKGEKDTGEQTERKFKQKQENASLAVRTMSSSPVELFMTKNTGDQVILNACLAVVVASEIGRAHV